MVFVLSDSQMETLKEFIADNDLEDALIDYVDELDKSAFREWLGWEQDGEEGD